MPETSLVIMKQGYMNALNIKKNVHALNII